MKVTQQTDSQNFYGHGKLLITGEYFVLDGALALAVPTKPGQSLRVKQLSGSDNNLYWVALNSKKQPWLNLVFDKQTLLCINSQQPEAQRLSQVLSEARKLNDTFLVGNNDLAVETQLEFPNEWGLGSSSTLIHCVATWACVDGYTLLQNTLGGSGYDVACAGNNTPILYRLQSGKPETIVSDWNPSFRNNLYFAYTGKKKVSSDAIQYYKTQLQNKEEAIAALDKITNAILASSGLKEFEQLLNEHETIIANRLKLEKVKDVMFADYWGAVKSLGAWGGDFVLMTNERSEEELKQYLAGENIPTLFSWESLILSR